MSLVVFALTDAPAWHANLHIDVAAAGCQIVEAHPREGQTEPATFACQRMVVPLRRGEEFIIICSGPMADAQHTGWRTYLSVDELPDALARLLPDAAADLEAAARALRTGQS